MAVFRKTYTLLLLLIYIPFGTFAQTKRKKDSNNKTIVPQPAYENKILLPTLAYNGETLPTITIQEFPVIAARVFRSEKEKQAYLKLKRDVKKAYPYAILASVKLKEYDAILANMNEKERTPYLKKTERELKEQFESDLKNLTMNQGRILIRLIDRETGKTTYKVIHDYRGTFSAFVWQSFSLLWGNNLKWKYDPSKGEDKLIEELIQQIQDGEV
ncbi:MAG: DUF4294 domain-containing protein [Bacteroidetes bacterium]|nr:DUF4294 domain-containing protein [Bacteroidota bacterium]